MKEVYDKNGGYTEEAMKIGTIVRNELEKLIKTEIEAGTSIKALTYVCCKAIHTEILKQHLKQRIKATSRSKR